MLQRTVVRTVYGQACEQRTRYNHDLYSLFMDAQKSMDTISKRRRDHLDRINDDSIVKSVCREMADEQEVFLS